MNSELFIKNKTMLQLFKQLQQDGTIPKIDDDYFKNLIVQFDFTFPQSVCPGISNMEIAICRFVGMSLFYILSYTIFPKRLLRLVKNIFGKKFQAGSLFEQRVHDSLVRRQLL